MDEREDIPQPQSERDEEPVEGLPVLAEVRPLAPAPLQGRASLPAVQAAAAAATGLLAGAATFALLRRHAGRRSAGMRGAPVRGRLGELGPIVSSRTYLVDVHLIAKPGE